MQKPGNRREESSSFPPCPSLKRYLYYIRVRGANILISSFYIYFELRNRKSYQVRISAGQGNTKVRKHLFLKWVRHRNDKNQYFQIPCIRDGYLIRNNSTGSTVLLFATIFQTVAWVDTLSPHLHSELLERIFYDSGRNIWLPGLSLKSRPSAPLWISERRCY